MANTFWDTFSKEKLSNAGTSDGAIKGWDSRRSASSYKQDALIAQTDATHWAIKASGYKGSSSKRATSAADRATHAANNAEKSALVSDKKDYDKAIAGVAHNYAGRAHLDAAVGGTPHKDYHESMAAYHQKRFKELVGKTKL